jgi:hypothetical protein
MAKFLWSRLTAPQIRLVLFLFGCSPGVLVSFRVRIGFAQEGKLGLAGMATAVYWVKSMWPNLAPLANLNYKTCHCWPLHSRPSHTPHLPPFSLTGGGARAEPTMLYRQGLRGPPRSISSGTGAGAEPLQQRRWHEARNGRHRSRAASGLVAEI